MLVLCGTFRRRIMLEDDNIMKVDEDEKKNYSKIEACDRER
jgi:hypothetical protein